MRPGPVPGPIAGCRSGNGEKLSCSQAEPGQAINSAPFPVRHPAIGPGNYLSVLCVPRVDVVEAERLHGAAPPLVTVAFPFPTVRHPAASSAAIVTFVALARR